VFRGHASHSRFRRQRIIGLVTAGIVVWLLWAPAARGAKDTESDDVIHDRVIRALVNDYELKTNALKVDVQEGAVTVTGTVKSEKLRRRVNKVISDTKGVKKVINKVEVRQ
jgi:osmotically-inducible protein OsmY